MGKPGSTSTADNASYAGIGSVNRRTAAKRVLPVVGIGGTILEGVAGAGGAGAAVDVSALAGRDVYLSTEGVTRFRVNAAPTATAWHLSLPAGPVQALHLPDDAATIAGWGVGGAWAFVVVPCDQET